jgi:hypothetical protein
MTAQTMPRRAATYRLDDRILEALERIARKNNTSVNKYLENLLFTHTKQLGEIPMTAESLGETRGGSRKGAGRAKSSQQESPTDGKPTA